jgi:uncharacterized protein (DUF58 family)
MATVTDTKELISRVRKIEIKTRGLSEQIFSGDYHSAFKGRGMAFSEVREYTPGDDVRTIDWNVTARTGDAYVKVFEEERELTMVIVADISASGNYGTIDQLKSDLIAELTAVLSFSAMKNNDKIGLLLFSDIIELYVPPKKGKKHILRMIRELLEHKPNSRGTDIGKALEFMLGVVKKRAIVFLMSDFISADFEKQLAIIGRRHDTVAINISDRSEGELANIGLVPITDPETGKRGYLDTASKKNRDLYSKLRSDTQIKLKQLFTRKKVDMLELSPGKDYVVPLHTFFKKRSARL